MITSPLHFMERKGIPPKSSSRQEEPGLEPSGLTPRPASPTAPPLPAERRQTVLEGTLPCARSPQGSVPGQGEWAPERAVPRPPHTELLCMWANTGRKRTTEPQCRVEQGLGFLSQVFSLVGLTRSEPTELINDDRHGEGLIFIFKNSL